MILKLPGVEDIVMGSTWNLPFSMGVTVKVLGVAEGENNFRELLNDVLVEVRS